jgi:aarF domain-containing kinase
MLAPDEYLERFQPMCMAAPVKPFETVKEVIETQLGAKLEDLFETFDPKPISTASIAQVHEATLKGTGERVAVKVQHKWLKESVHGDLFLIDMFVRTAEWYFPEFRYKWLSEETSDNLPQELDFMREGRNADRCRQLLADLKHIKIPQIYWKLTSVHDLASALMTNIDL